MRFSSDEFKGIAAGLSHMTMVEWVNGIAAGFDTSSNVRTVFIYLFLIPKFPYGSRQVLMNGRMALKVCAAGYKSYDTYA